MSGGPIDKSATVEVIIEGDTYTLREFLGWYEHQEVGGTENDYSFELPTDWGDPNRNKIEKVKVTPKKQDGKKNLARLMTSIVAWHYQVKTGKGEEEQIKTIEVKITEDNVKRLIPSHGKKLLKIIAALGSAKQPFRAESESANR